VQSTSDFERLVLCHLDAAYNLARWLSASPHDADDIVQEACLRAHRAFQTLRSDDARAWLLTIVRNVFLNRLEQKRSERLRLVTLDHVDLPSEKADEPITGLIQSADAQRLHQAIASLEIEFRETIVLREIEGLSYKQVAEVTRVPIGTVMSRLARARKRLFDLLCEEGDTAQRARS